MTKIKTIVLCHTQIETPFSFRTETLATPTESDGIFIPIEIKDELNVPYRIL